MLIMAYIILTERDKTNGTPYGKNVFWSRAFGAFSKACQATNFDSFEAAQPKVTELRKSYPECYFYAIET